jgi:hypothetical protein
MRTAEIANRCSSAALAPILSLMLAVMTIAAIGDVAQVFGQTGKQMNRPSRVKAPEWYDKVPADDSTLVVRGRADLKDQQVAVDKAVATARSGLAATIDRRWKELLQAIQKEGLIAPERTEESVTLEGSTMPSFWWPFRNPLFGLHSRRDCTAMQNGIPRLKTLRQFAHLKTFHRE